MQNDGKPDHRRCRSQVGNHPWKTTKVDARAANSWKCARRAAFSHPGGDVHLWICGVFEERLPYVALEHRTSHTWVDFLL